MQHIKIDFMVGLFIWSRPLYLNKAGAVNEVDELVSAVYSGDICCVIVPWSEEQ